MNQSQMTEWIAFLQKHGGQLASSDEHPNEVIDSFGNKMTEFNDLGSTIQLFPLDDRAIIALNGADTDKLLQGQLSCDMTAITANDAGSGAMCTVKGRMISNFSVCRDAKGDSLLIIHQALVHNTIDTLKKYAVFYKTSITDQSANYRVFGLAGAGAVSFIQTITGSELTGTCLHWNDLVFFQSGQQRWVVLVPSTEAADLWLQLVNQAKPAGLPLWHLLSIRDGLGEVRPETVEEFIPQMLNLQHTGAINFRKGCYTGQEIVARMQYLGKLKRRMYRLSINGQTVPAAGTEVFIPGETRNSGQVVMAAQAPHNRVELLAVLTAEAAATEILQFGRGQYEVEQLALPYDKMFVERTQG